MKQGKQLLFYLLRQKTDMLACIDIFKLIYFKLGVIIYTTELCILMRV